MLVPSAFWAYLIRINGWMHFAARRMGFIGALVEKSNKKCFRPLVTNALARNAESLLKSENLLHVEIMHPRTGLVDAHKPLS